MLVDTSSHISEIVEVRWDVLVNFLVVLARVVNTVAPRFILERQCFIMMLVGKMTLAAVVIRSWRG